MGNISLEDIVLQLKEYDPEEIKLSIDKAEFRPDSSFIDITVQTQVDKLREEKWRIHLIGHLSGHLSTNTSYYIDQKKDHPLLWDYNDLQASLYFNGEPDDFHKFYWDLYNVHKSIYGSYFTVDKYLNDGILLNKLMMSRNGLLAKGPKNLLIKFAECLEKHGVQSSIINGVAAVYWNGNEMVPASQNLSVLFIGESYIISNDFKIENL